MSIADKLTTIAENEQKVYEAGKKSQYDEFWDAYQQYGNRYSYGGAFFGLGWTLENFKPKYDIVLRGGTSNTFREFNIPTLDMQEWFDSLGIVFDTKQCTGFSYDCYGTKCEVLPHFDLTSATAVSYLFANSTARRITITVAETTPFTNAFQNCKNLVDLVVRGTIGKNGLDLKDSTLLSKASIDNVVTALSNNTYDLTVTLSRMAVKKAYETSPGANNGDTSAEWIQRVNSRPDWTINLS